MARTQISASEWTEIDVETLPAQIKAAYNEYVAARKLASDKRTKFETAMSAAIKLPSGKRPVFGHNFGKLSMAIVADTTTPKASSKAVSFSSLKG